MSKFDLKLDDGRERDFDDIICDFFKKYTWFSIGHGLWSTLGRYIYIVKAQASYLRECSEQLIVKLRMIMNVHLVVALCRLAL